VPILLDQVVASLLPVGPTGIFARDPSDAIFNPNSADKIPTAFDFRWNLKDTDTE